jgi:hypothetical protein
MPVEQIGHQGNPLDGRNIWHYEYCTFGGGDLDVISPTSRPATLLQERAPSHA